MVVMGNDHTSKVDGLFGCSEENDSAGVSLEGFQDSTRT